MSVKSTQLHGDVSVGRNVAIGGRANVQGSATVHHNLRVDGWLDAKNVKCVNKGVFPTIDALLLRYPNGTLADGCWAIVGGSLPGELWYVHDGVWTDSGKTAGEVTADVEQYLEDLENLSGDVDTLQSDLAEEASSRKSGDDSLQESLKSLSDAVNRLRGTGYRFMGVASPGTNPGSPAERVFYVATSAGEYAHFGDSVTDIDGNEGCLSVDEGEVALLTYDGYSGTTDGESLSHKGWVKRPLDLWTAAKYRLDGLVGSSDGIAGLDTDGVVPLSQLPVSELLGMYEGLTVVQEWGDGVGCACDELPYGDGVYGYNPVTARLYVTSIEGSGSDAVTRWKKTSASEHKLYVSASQNQPYRWDGSQMVAIGVGRRGALERVVKVADEKAATLLTTSEARLGDTVKVLSTGKLYIVIDESKLSADGKTAGSMDAFMDYTEVVSADGVEGLEAYIHSHQMPEVDSSTIDGFANGAAIYKDTSDGLCQGLLVARTSVDVVGKSVGSAYHEFAKESGSTYGIQLLVSGTGLKWRDKVPGSASWSAWTELGGSSALVDVTYADLCSLVGGKGLTPGKQYRITDYVTTTSQYGTKSAGHRFDVIVTADSAGTLHEEARAVLHDGDGYFAGSLLHAWKIWYCLDNDTARFSWADSTNGKGVIYRMIDEWGNDLPYDFKNILFTRDLDGSGSADFYTFNKSLTEVSDMSLIKDSSVFGNVMGVYTVDGKRALNGNIFVGPYVHRNRAGVDFHGNVAGASFCLNTFGNQCSGNTFGEYCSYNRFGDLCQHNTLPGYSQHNTLEGDCSYNSLVFGGVSSLGDKIRYYRLKRGMRFSAGSPNAISVEANHDYETVVGKDSSGDVVEYCPADIPPVIDDGEVRASASGNLNS